MFLRFWLSTKEERPITSINLAFDKVNNNLIDQESLIDVIQHVNLIRKFALHEIYSSNVNTNFFLLIKIMF